LAKAGDSFIDRRIQTEEGKTPAPGLEFLFAGQGAGAQDDQQRQEQADRGRGLDEGREQAALAVRRVFGHVGGGAAVLSAQRQALQDAQGNEDDRRRDADLLVARQDADQEGRGAHQQDGHQEGVLTADHVAQAAEHQRAERAHDEAGGEGEQGEDEGCIRVADEELLGDDGSERTVEIEVVPFENGAEGRRGDNLAFFLGESGGGGCSLSSDSIAGCDSHGCLRN